MTLKELSVYLKKLFPDNAPTKGQLREALRAGKFSAHKIRQNPLSRVSVWDVPEDQVKKVENLFREGLQQDGRDNNHYK